jgi:hypothetical protein
MAKRKLTDENEVVPTSDEDEGQIEIRVTTPTDKPTNLESHDPMATRAWDNPAARSALIFLGCEVDRWLRHGPNNTMESRMRQALETPGVRAILYGGVR